MPLERIQIASSQNYMQSCSECICRCSIKDVQILNTSFKSTLPILIKWSQMHWLQAILTAWNLYPTSKCWKAHTNFHTHLLFLKQIVKIEALWSRNKLKSIHRHGFLFGLLHKIFLHNKKNKLHTEKAMITIAIQSCQHQNPLSYL